MGTQSAAEDFMRRFFKERTNTLRQMLEVQRPFRERFYDPNCLYDSRKDSIEQSEAEVIESVKWDESGFLVVKFGEKVVGRRRFDVELNGGTLRIMETEYECSCLRHKYDATGCKYCGGRGWLNSRERLRSPEGFDVPSSEAVSDAELVGSGTMDSEILQFMAEHFRERAAVMMLWEEIYGAFTKRFFSPGANWECPFYPAAYLAQEEVIGTQAGKRERLAITKGGSPLRLRYHLRRAEANWLITDVAFECPLCLWQGRKPDCLVCGGTIWERKWKS